MEEIIITPQVCMQFLVWSYYYHNIMPTKDMSYADCGKFSRADADRLDQLRDSLFLCFEQESVFNACAQLCKARQLHEPCPFPQAQLDAMFASEQP